MELSFMTKKALITGITGQDGSYLAELLLEKGYEVHGLIRRSSSFNTQRVEHLYVDPHEMGADNRFFLHYGDLSDSTVLRRVLEKVQPQEVYNLAAQSHVKLSFEEPVYTVDIDAIGCLRLLEAMRDYCERTGAEIRFYQASSSEMFGASPPPQLETTQFHPRSPYACAKVYSFWQTVNVCNPQNYACCGSYQTGSSGQVMSGKFVCQTGLGTCTRLCQGNVDDASAP
jgi:GDPmannose 4,6-dehydratase